MAVTACYAKLQRLRSRGQPAPALVDREPSGGLIVDFVEGDSTFQWTFYNDGREEYTRYVHGIAVDMLMSDSPSTLSPRSQWIDSW